MLIRTQHTTMYILQLEKKPGVHPGLTAVFFAIKKMRFHKVLFLMAGFYYHYLYITSRSTQEARGKQQSNSNTCVLNLVENTRGTSAQLRHQTADSLSVQKANEIVHRVLQSKPVAPIRVDRLDFLLHGYDRFLKQFLVYGFRFGFRIHFVGERFSSETPNLKSAVDQPVLTHAKLCKECDAGRIVGPFTVPPFQIFVALHWALFPKKIHLNFD